MAQDCEFGMFQDNALSIQFVCLMGSAKMQSRLLNKHDLKSFEKAILIASAMEITGRQLEIMKQSNYHVNTIGTVINTHHTVTSRREAIADNSAAKNPHNQIQQHERKKHVLCFVCGLYGLIKKYCRSYQKGKNKINNMTSVKTNEEAGMFNDVGFLNNYNNNNKSNAHKITTKINCNEIEIQIDTAACESVVSRSIVDKNS